MSRKACSLFLVVAILLSLVTVGVSAEEVLTTSDDAVTMLKAEEGFSSKPYWDYAQWTVGYGTKCPDDMLEYYKQHGIQEEEAESLLRTYLTRFESELHKFMARTGVELNQNQFDALLLFTYNCGSGWSYDANGVFYNAIVSGATGNELVYAFSRWCSAGGQILTGLLRRRLCEANIYLNGIYSQTIPENLGYVIYDACGGKTSPSVQGYDTVLTAEILSQPSYEGHTFAGWFTEKAGGTEVKKLDDSVRNSRLYAHWIDSEGNDISEDTSGVTITVATSGVNIRSGAGTDHSVVGMANKGDQFLITETAEGTGYTWGKFATGWICLDFTDYDKIVAEEQPKVDNTVDNDSESTPTEPEATMPEEKPIEPEKPKSQMGTVTVSDTLRVRSGPSTGYDVAGYLKNGDRVEILEQQIVGAMIWGRIDKGWISLSYVTLDEQTEKPESEKPAETVKVIATGTVQVNTSLRVRSGPGTSYDLAGFLSKGDKVEILEMQDSGNATWGRIDKGWISLDYVVLDEKKEESPKPVTGIAQVEDLLRIRSGAGTAYAIAGYLSNGSKVEILEQKTVGSTTWGRIEKGWISLDYVVLDDQSPETTVIKKTVTADCLRIRSNAGTSYTIVGYLYRDAKVEILETKSVEGTQWGRVAEGWISMDYVK